MLAGSTAEGNLMMFYVNPKDGSFTIVEFIKDKTLACVISGGKDLKIKSDFFRVDKGIAL